jgi:hypothetical protein
MYTTGTLLSWVLAVAPATPTDFDTRVSDIEVVTANDAAEVLVYDGAGEVSAVLVIWIDSEQRVRLDADFADGLYLSTVVDGEDPVIESNNRAVVAERLSTIMDNTSALDDVAPDDGTTTAGIGGCAWSAIGTASACAGVRPIFCVVGAAVMACNCLPLIVDEWEEYSCPGFG